MSFVAAFDGPCSDCGQNVAGHLCTYRDRHAGLVHVVCPENPSEVADRAALANARCPRCGLNHPGEC